MPTPFEIIAAPVIVYQAALGESMPLIDAAVAGNWAKIGTSGDRNITEDGVTVEHPDETESFYSVGGTGPVEVHVPRPGCRRRVLSQAALLLADLRQVHAQATQFFGHGSQQVAGFFQFIEILCAEHVVPVVAGRPFHAAFKQVV